MITAHFTDRLVTKLICYFTVLAIIPQDFLYISGWCEQQTAGGTGIAHARKCVCVSVCVSDRWGVGVAKGPDALGSVEMFVSAHQKLWKMLHLSIWVKPCCRPHNPVNIALLPQPWECEFFRFRAS